MLMAKSRVQKEAMLKELNEDLLTRSALVFANYSGLTVAEMEELRRNLRKEGSALRVVKKTLLRKALDASTIEGAKGMTLEGEISIALAEKDEIAPARALYQFGKKHEALKIFAGVLEHRVIEKDRVIALAQLPTREELIARAVGSIRAPIANFVGVGSALLRKLVGTLSAIQAAKA